jgi:hypothetical protein
MANPLHKFYCMRCGMCLYGETLAELARNVNYHATSLHPSDFANWTESTISASAHYSVSVHSTPLPQYRQPFGTTSRAGSLLPMLSESDKKMLEEAKIRW